VGEGEPLWLDEDREWALALQAYEASLCNGCGQPLSQTTGEHPAEFESDIPDESTGCTALRAGMADYADHPKRESLKFRLIQKTSPNP